MDSDAHRNHLDLAIAEVRREHPNLGDLPDPVIADLFITRQVALRLSVVDLGRAIRAELPRPVRRLLGR